MTRSRTRPPDVGTAVRRGVLAGLAGTAVMTGSQRLVEMPLTGRAESDAPLRLVETLLPIPRTTGGTRRVLTYVAHFGIGALWGAAHGVIQRATGTRGARATVTVFGVLYAGDVALNTALGVYEPRRWSAQDWIVDVGDKYLLAQATTSVYERLGPRTG